MKHVLPVAALALAASTAAAWAAPVYIDRFDGSQTVSNPGFGGFNPTDSGLFPNVIGAGSRDLTVAGNGSGFPEVTTISVNGGTASITNGASTTGTALFEWDGLGTDLTDGGTNKYIELSILTADLNVDYTLTINGTSVTKALSSGTVLPSRLIWDFTEFGTTDLSNVGAMSLFVSGPQSFDASFDFIAATVPLPGGAALAFGALGSLMVLRRRKRA